MAYIHARMRDRFPCASNPALSLSLSLWEGKRERERDVQVRGYYRKLGLQLESREIGLKPCRLVAHQQRARGFIQDC